MQLVLQFWTHFISESSRNGSQTPDSVQTWRQDSQWVKWSYCIFILSYHDLSHVVRMFLESIKFRSLPMKAALIIFFHTVQKSSSNPNSNQWPWTKFSLGKICMQEKVSHWKEDGVWKHSKNILFISKSSFNHFKMYTFFHCKNKKLQLNNSISFCIFSLLSSFSFVYFCFKEKFASVLTCACVYNPSQGYSTPYPPLVRSPSSVGSECRGEKILSDDNESVSSLIPTYLNSLKKLMIE